MTASHDPRIDVLASLVNRLRREVEVLEAKRLKLALAEATLELLLRQGRKDAAKPSEEGSRGHRERGRGAGRLKVSRSPTHRQVRGVEELPAFPREVMRAMSSVPLARWLVADVIALGRNSLASIWPRRCRCMCGKSTSHLGCRAWRRLG
jgi:hypothetical protein